LGQRKCRSDGRVTTWDTCVAAAAVSEGSGYGSAGGVRGADGGDGTGCGASWRFVRRQRTEGWEEEGGSGMRLGKRVTEARDWFGPWSQMTRESALLLKKRMRSS